MSLEPLADARERDLAAHDLITTYLVEAAAGTGKTTVLVRRVIHILRETLTPITRIVAITFTEKAAGELKNRIRSSIEAELAAGRDNEDHLANALMQLDRMPVGTIHSFCRDILMDNAVLAGLDPEFTMLDKSVAESLKSESWQQWLRTELQQPPAALRDLMNAGVFDSIASAANFLESVYEVLIHERADLEHIRVEKKSHADVTKSVEDFVRETAVYCTMKHSCTASDDLLVQQVVRVEQWLALRPHDEIPLLLKWLISAPVPKGNLKGREQNWTNRDTLLAVREFFFKDWREWRGNLLAECASQLAAPLVEWLKAAATNFDRAKERRGALDFDDLLLYTRNLLRDSENVRSALKLRFDDLLVDEFQDTDPLQTEIMFFLAEKTGQFNSSWKDVELEEGKLFIVGDPKQSIYRFRRADMDLYRSVRDKILEAGAVINIGVNFRSDPGILTEVNELFRPLMISTDDSHYEPDYVELLWPAAAECAVEPPLTFLKSPRFASGEVLSTVQSAEIEADMIASYIATEVREERRHFRDICVLFESRTHLSQLEAALRNYDIPFQVFGGRAFGQRPEIMALRTLLEAIDNPFDEIAVAGALRLPVIGCSDRALAEHANSGTNFQYTSVNSPSVEIERAFVNFRRWHEFRYMKSTSELVEQIFRDTVMLQLAALAPYGEMRVANLRKALDLARAAELSGVTSLSAFLNMLYRFEEYPAEFDDPLAVESGDNVVSLMTFHKSKGLEFPCVILYRTAHAKAVKKSHLYDRKTQRLEVNVLADLQTTGYAEAFQVELVRQNAEKKRLLYVAMTRAKQTLAIPTIFDPAPRDKDRLTHAALLKTRFDAAASAEPLPDDCGYQVLTIQSYEPEYVHPDIARVVVPERVNPSDVERAQLARDQWLESVRAIRCGLNSPQTERAWSKDANINAASYREESEAALRIGSAVHRMLEHMNFEQPLSGDALRKLIRQYGILLLHEEARTATLIETALHSEPFRDLRKNAMQIHRELPFAYSHHSEVIEGKIDLFIEQPNSYSILDYKTDSALPSDMNILLSRHAAQLKAYRQAVQAVLPDKPVHAYLYYLTSDQLIALPD